MPTISLEQKQKPIERLNAAIKDQGLIISKNGILAEWINPEIDFVEKNPDIATKISADEKADEQSVKERLKKSQEIMNEHRKIAPASKELNLNQEQTMNLFEMFIENLVQEISSQDNTQTQNSNSLKNKDEILCDSIPELTKKEQQIPEQYNGFLEGLLELEQKDAKLFNQWNKSNPANKSKLSQESRTEEERKRPASPTSHTQRYQDGKNTKRLRA
jgi:hypothetical protein